MELAPRPDDPAPASGPSPAVLVTITLAGAAAVTLSVTLALTNHDLVRPGLQAFLINWITVPYTVGGLLAWSRRPASRLGPLMITTGLMMALVALQWSSDPYVSALGHLLDLVPAALFLHVFLAFPTGRLGSPAERAVVLSCYGVGIGLQLLKVLLGVDPADPLTVATQPALAARAEQAQLVIIAGLLLVGAATLAVRRRRAGRPARRGVALTVDAFGVSLVMLATLYLAALSSWPAFEALRNVTFAVLGLAPIAFLFGLLDARLARADVGELVVRLRADPTGNLRQHLADALHDPTLAVAYWLPQAGSWADQSGRRVRLPEPGRGRATRLIRQDDQPVAALIFDHSLEDERELLDAVVAAAAIALENGRLESELRAQLHELRDSRVRVLEAGRKERQRLERNLHDGAQQRLVALTLELGRWENDLTNPKDRVRIGRVRSQLAESLGELRDVSRGIYPAVLTGHGLAVALESLTARTAVPVRLDVTVGDRLPEAVEVAAYYIVAEGLTNLDKHAQARSAAVRVAPASDGVVVEVCDDGRGGADALGGSGLRGLADRVEALGGTLQIWSPPGEGTRLTADLPIPADGEGPRSTTGGLPK